MGSWNGTCGISNLPIEHGDEVVLFIIREKNLSECRGGGFYAPADLFEPISLPIIGRYKGYGLIDNIENENLILPKIVKMFEKNKLLYFSKDESILDIKKASLYEIIKEIELENIKGVEKLSVIKFYELEGIKKPEFLNIGIIMFHKELYDMLLKQSSVEYYKKKYLDIIEASKSDLSFLDSIEESFVWNISRVPFEFIVDYLIDVVSNSDNELLEKIIEVSLINNVLSSLRKSWMPQVGLGSQSLVNEEHLLLANFIVKKYNKEKNQE